MAEKLCSLKKIGGGGGSDFDPLTPDLSNYSRGMATGGTVNVTVTQKPKKIIILTAGDSVVRYLLGIYDVETNTGKCCGYYSGSYHGPLENWTTISNYITSVTATNVTLRNGVGQPASLYYEIYY